MDGRSAANHDVGTDRATANARAAKAGAGRADAPPKVPTRRTMWADLLRRVFEVDALRCPRCGGRMRALAAIMAADVAQQILACLSLPTRTPPLTMNRPGALTRAWPKPKAPSAARTDALWSAFDFDPSTPAEWDVGA